MLPGPLCPEPCPPGLRCSPPLLFGHPPCQALGLQPWVGSCGALQASSVSSPWPPSSVETPLLLWLKPLGETAEAIPQIQMTGLQAARVPALSLAQTQACVTGGGLVGLSIPPGGTSPSLPPHVRKSRAACYNLDPSPSVSSPSSSQIAWRRGDGPARFSERKRLLSAARVVRMPAGQGAGRCPPASPGSGRGGWSGTETWCQGCDAQRAAGSAEGAGKPGLGGQQRAWRWSWGDGVSGEHPVWGTEGHRCTLPTLQFWGRVAPGLLGVGDTGIWQPP